MGSSSSKPARKLGQQATSQTLRSGNVSRPAPSARQPAPPTPETQSQGSRYAPPVSSQSQRYSESKTQDVRNDGQDPQLLANLQKIGQVQVPRGKVRYQQANPMLNILAARQSNTVLEEEASQTATRGSSNARGLKNRLNAPSLVALLDERKECKSRREVEELAVAYDVDITTLDQLARWVNSPSVEAGASTRQRQPVNIGSEDELPDKINAVWTEPKLSDVRGIPSRA